MDNELVNTAGQLAVKGWYVHPVKDKGPILKDWTNKSTNQPGEILPMFREHSFANGVGINCGLSRIVVVDIDMPDGVESVKRIIRSHGELPETLTQKTPSGGGHLIYRAVDGLDIRNSESDVGFKIDIRGSGGQIVYYGWTDPDVEVAVCNPRWYFRMMTKKRYLKILDEELDRVLDLPHDENDVYQEGTGREKALNVAALKLGHYIPAGFEENYIRDIIKFVGKKIGLEDHDIETKSQKSVSDGMSEPKQLLFSGNDADVDTKPKPNSMTDFLNRNSSKASEIKPEDPVFLWEGLIEDAGIAMLIGDGGVGKGMMSVWLISQLTRGLLPGDYKDEPIKVCYISNEEIYDKHTVPRLLAAEADMDSVTLINLRSIEDFYFKLNERKECDEFCQWLQDGGYKLCMLDPWVDFFPEMKESESEVRRHLTTLQNAAIKRGLTILGNRHTPKGARSQNDKAIGSKAWWNVPRSAITIQHDPDNRENRFLYNAKVNNTKEDSTARGFHIGSKFIDGLVKSVGYVEWNGTVINTSELIDLETMTTKERETTTNDKETKNDKIIEYFSGHQGSVKSTDAIKYFRSIFGVSRQTVYNYMHNLDVDMGTKGDPNSMWTLPEDKVIKNQPKPISPM